MLGERGVRVYRVVADEIGRRRPFGLVSALLGLEEHYPPLAETPDIVMEAVEKRCAEGPVALCADDVHHADADSLALLGRLAGAARDLPLSLVLARRALPVRETLDALAARPDVRTIEVVGLGPDGLEQLVLARLGAPPGPRLRELLAVTGGNPFHAGVLLDDLERQGRLGVTEAWSSSGATPTTSPPRSRRACAPTSPCSTPAPGTSYDCWPSGGAHRASSSSPRWARPRPSV